MEYHFNNNSKTKIFATVFDVIFFFTWTWMEIKYTLNRICNVKLFQHYSNNSKGSVLIDKYVKTIHTNKRKHTTSDIGIDFVYGKCFFFILFSVEQLKKNCNARIQLWTCELKMKWRKIVDFFFFVSFFSEIRDLSLKHSKHIEKHTGWFFYFFFFYIIFIANTVAVAVYISLDVLFNLVSTYSFSIYLHFGFGLFLWKQQQEEKTYGIIKKSHTHVKCFAFGAAVFVFLVIFLLFL